MLGLTWTTRAERAAPRGDDRTAREYAEGPSAYGRVTCRQCFIREVDNFTTDSLKTDGLTSGGPPGRGCSWPSPVG